MNRPLVELDLECYPDYFLAKFYDERTGRFCSVGVWEGNPLDIPQIVRILQMVTIITFNGVGYDVPMLTLALYGATNAQLKEANDDIIVRGLKPWEFYQKSIIEPLDYIDHIDTMEVAPGVRISLKCTWAGCRSAYAGLAIRSVHRARRLRSLCDRRLLRQRFDRHQPAAP